MDKIRVLIVDDSIFARSRLKQLLSDADDIEIVGEAAEGHEAVIMLDDLNPHVLLLEASDGESMEFEDIVKKFRSFAPDLKIILCAEPKMRDRIISSVVDDAHDFVAKPYNKQLLLRAVKSSMA